MKVKINAMIKKTLLRSALLLLLGISPFLVKAQNDYIDLNRNGQMDAYENPRLSVEQRVDNLVSLMTLEEKVGQLVMTMGWGYYECDKDEVWTTEDFANIVKNVQIGSMWALMRADPWTQKDFSNGLSPQNAHYLTNEMQRYVRSNTRLGIPLLFAEECPHGLMALDAPVFPTAIGRASTFNSELEFQVGREVGRCAARQGANIAFGPVLDVSREPRWSRFEENYGEDPVLSATMGIQYMQGLQSQGLISTLKHFTAYGVPEGGHNGASAHVGNRELLSVLSYPFMKAVQGGALSVMTSYNDVDGVPCSANEWLLKNILRDTWHFNGLVISDLFAINGLVSSRLASDYEEAAALAVKAGVNIDLGGSCYGQPLIDAVQHGLVTETMVDELLRPVLRIKFQLGLFDNPFYDNKIVSVDNEFSRKVAQESVILLKNDDHLLPLNKKIGRIAVIGPNADNMYNMLGDYTAPQRPEAVVTVLEGVREAFPQSKIDYEKGCSIRDTSWEEIGKAVRAARESDVVILALGGSSARDFNTTFEKTGAADASTKAEKAISDMEAGEGFDRASLALMGYQQKLLEAVCATGKPVVLVLIQGRPLDISWASQNVPAILCAWYPGAQGGRAIADILAGDCNPSGHLPVSYPRSVGQLPVYYNTISTRRAYTDESAQPLFPFGYGLSYTNFQYDSIQCTQLPDNKHKISFTLINTGDMDGAEVVQLYVGDEQSSVILPERQLKQFKKVFLKKKESKEVEFILSDEDLALMNQQCQWVVEPGRFVIYVGSSVSDIRLQTSLTR